VLVVVVVAVKVLEHLFLMQQRHPLELQRLVLVVALLVECQLL
jgi:hypothetical protein